MLDNFALVSGQINTLNRLLKSEKMPLLRNQICLPLVLTPDRDPELEVTNIFYIMIFNDKLDSTDFADVFYNMNSRC